ncbi:hypothetical protein YC2023_121875 [Brassica napus]
MALVLGGSEPDHEGSKLEHNDSNTGKHSPPVQSCLGASAMKDHATEEFENLCLILGIELDAVTTEKAIIRKEKHIEEEEADDDEEVIYK